MKNIIGTINAANKSGLALAIVALVMVCILSSVAAFNYKIDPQCFYHCSSIDISRPTVNAYYKEAQRILAYPKAQVIVLGSSRGESTPPGWVREETKMKAINVSVGGAELYTKLALLHFAQKKLELKKVIWFADYFELIPESQDKMIKNTIALRQYIFDDSASSKKSLRRSLLFTRPPFSMASLLNRGLSLIDHNSLEASLYFLKENKISIMAFLKNDGAVLHGKTQNLSEGGSIGKDFSPCLRNDFHGKTTAEMEKQAADDYDFYVHRVFSHSQSQKEEQLFFEQMEKLNQEKINVFLFITPYNPRFMKRLRDEHPDVYAHHLEWIQKLIDFSQGKAYLHFYNYFDGIPSDDSSVHFWDDGIHYTCSGVIKMLRGKLK